MVRCYKIYRHGRYKSFDDFNEATDYYDQLRSDGQNIMMFTEHYCFMDRFFESAGLTRENFNMILKIGKDRYLVPSLSSVWWIIYSVGLVLGVVGLWSLTVLLIILFG